jgi:hypothetical protein
VSLRTLAIASTAAAVVAGIVATHLWRELRAERQLTEELRTQLAGSTAGQSPAPLAAPGIDQRASVPMKEQAPPGATTIDASEQELLQDPEYRNARRQAEGYAAALAQDGVPLDGAQTRAIAVALSNEQKSLKQDIVALARKVDLSFPQTQLDAQAALKKRQEESNQRVLDAVYPVLGAQQMFLLRGHMEQQAAAAQKRADQ